VVATHHGGVPRVILNDPRPRRRGTVVGDGGLRLYLAYSQAHPLLSLTMVALGLGAAWCGCLLLGGSRTAGPHLFYVAIVLAAVRFAWPVVAATAVAAGVLAGPLLPADIDAGIPQVPSAWLLRLGIFVGVGVFMALLVKAPDDSFCSRLQDAVASARLLRGLKAGAIEAFYQPIYRVDGCGIVGVEALARWRRSGDQLASPADFIPMAERTGTIVKLDEFILSRSVATARDWTAEGEPIAVSVNFSAATLLQPDIAEAVGRILQEVGFPADLLQVEITESALIHDLARAVRQVEALRAMGVKVAIDDFGSGRASLHYLQNLPVDVVKLDRSIVTLATIDVRSRRLLEGVIHMCELLELRLVAEGVEFPDQLSLLDELGVPMAQGFLLGLPMPAEEVDELLRQRTS
jgi:EAL domain-containing protein (putative c-di-GMP-specific phosphodiesterase class I)